MEILRTIPAMQQWSRLQQRLGRRIGCVPTMGALHEGHLSLVRLARQRADVVVVTVFVNPTQFGPQEDFARYPRPFERDCELCRAAGVEALFAPEPAAMYAPDATTWVEEGALSKPLCGERRPGHFRGVTTVVAKLFNAVLPDVAVFGQKDAQQALVLQRMVRDLNFPVELVIAPIVREADGLALSSRNVYLSADERRRALAISRGLRAAEAAFAAGERAAVALCGGVRAGIEAAGGRVDYVELRDRGTLAPLAVADRPALLAVAAFFGNTRLLDNVFLG
ncbi:MAG: pantoate--beta-alanine ligase [Lentisphaeria bacterium]|jgi:pantoate--beta-alanine ligase